MKKRCKRCTIILSEESKYGSFYPEHPRYCKDCWDTLNETEEKEDEFLAEQAEYARDQALEDAVSGALVD